MAIRCRTAILFLRKNDKTEKTTCYTLYMTLAELQCGRGGGGMGGKNVPVVTFYLHEASIALFRMLSVG